MSTTTITFIAKINGSLVDVDSIYFADAIEDFGVRRVDNLDVVVAKDTVIPRLSLGTYVYSFTDPDVGLTYEYTVKLTYLGTTYYYNRQNMAADIHGLVLIPSSTHYSSQTEVYRMLGEYAGELMIDDYASSDKSYIWNDILYDADNTIQMYIGQHYDPSLLYQNQWIRRRATVLVVNLLSQRRGNAPIWVGKTERTYDELSQIRDNRFHIPGAKPRSFQGPVVRNYMIQNRFYEHPIRVEKTKSTGQSYSGEDIAIEPFMYWF